MEDTTFTPAYDVVADLPERCDRCGSAAKLTVAITAGELSFCGHHANAYAQRIGQVALGVRVLSDFRWTGAPDPSTVDSGRPARVGPPRPYRNSR